MDFYPYNIKIQTQACGVLWNSHNWSLTTASEATSRVFRAIEFIHKVKSPDPSFSKNKTRKALNTMLGFIVKVAQGLNSKMGTPLAHEDYVDLLLTLSNSCQDDPQVYINT